MSLLESLFTKYGTDKGIWGYTGAYEKYLEHRRYEVEAVLEIGICGHRDIPNNVVGASLFVWKDYFPDADIYGIDNDSQFIFNDQQRIKTALADAYDTTQLYTALNGMDAPQFDFICDDAVHDPGPQMQLCMALWRGLVPGGVYAIEEACPYKVPAGDLWENFVKPLMLVHEDMTAEVFQTHKDERLVVLKKAR